MLSILVDLNPDKKRRGLTERTKTIIIAGIVVALLGVIIGILISDPLMASNGHNQFRVVSVNGQIAVLEDYKGIRIPAGNPFPNLTAGTYVRIKHVSYDGSAIVEIVEESEVAW